MVPCESAQPLRAPPPPTPTPAHTRTSPLPLQDTNIGARTYVMDTTSTYKMFKLLNQEFTFDVDVSTLPCGLNGALYFVEMDADGGMSKCVRACVRA